jgi:hypothetical protein
MDAIVWIYIIVVVAVFTDYKFIKEHGDKL